MLEIFLGNVNYYFKIASSITFQENIKIIQNKFQNICYDKIHVVEPYHHCDAIWKTTKYSTDEYLSCLFSESQRRKYMYQENKFECLLFDLTQNGNNVFSMHSIKSWI